MMEEGSPKVLSIQSHVVHGYVGNRSAVFPLQLLGFEVDFINSVQLCTHTMYKKVSGQILKEQDLSDLFEGLKENGLDQYDYLLTGYVGSPSFLKEIVAVYKHLKNVNPKIVFVCDPVMGDNGELYVPKELVPLYRECVVPHAHILTPNQFELELLTGSKISSIDDCWEAIEELHSKGCNIVVVSSSDLGGDGDLLALASTKIDTTSLMTLPIIFLKKKNVLGKSCRVSITLKKKQAIFVGTGDVFAALMLAWMHKTNNDLKVSLEKTIATLQAILDQTLQCAKGMPHTPANLELKLIQSKRDIEEPQVSIYANSSNTAGTSCK